MKLPTMKSMLAPVCIALSSCTTLPSKSPPTKPFSDLGIHAAILKLQSGECSVPQYVEDIIKGDKDGSYTFGKRGDAAVAVFPVHDKGGTFEGIFSQKSLNTLFSISTDIDVKKNMTALEKKLSDADISIMSGDNLDHEAFITNINAIIDFLKSEESNELDPFVNILIEMRNQVSDIYAVIIYNNKGQKIFIPSEGSCSVGDPPEVGGFSIQIKK